MTASRADILARSKHLGEPKYERLADKYISLDAEVLLADDGNLEFFDSSSMRRKVGYDHAFVLTADTLWAFRPRGLGGEKQPRQLILSEVTECGPTEKGNVGLKFKGEHGYPGFWKLLIFDQGKADLWTHVLSEALTRLTTAAESERADRLAAELANLAGAPPRVQATAPSQMTDAERGRFTRLHDLLTDLSAFAAPDKLGTPFGEGAGLELAMDRMFCRLNGVEDARQCARIMVTDLLVSGRDDAAADDLLRAMGATPEVARFGPPVKIAEDARQIGNAAVELIRQFEGPGSPGAGNMWELWCERDDVVGEMLCWHAVARLRMATAGRMDPVTRPAGT
jgi:hypothetical protein